MERRKIRLKRNKTRIVFIYLGATAVHAKAAVFLVRAKSGVWCGMIFSGQRAEIERAPFKINYTARTHAERHGTRGPRCKYTCETSVLRLYCSIIIAVIGVTLFRRLTATLTSQKIFYENFSLRIKLFSDFFLIFFIFQYVQPCVFMYKKSCGGNIS